MSDTPETPAPAKKGFGKWIVLAVVLLLLASGGAAGAYWWTHRSAAPDEHAKGEAHDAAPDDVAVVPLEPFVVNLSDKAASRYLRVTLRLVVAAEIAKEVAEDEVSVMRLRSAILELLTVQTSDRLVTPEGKAELKTAIAARASKILHDTKVVDVLFSDFVVQF